MVCKQCGGEILVKRIGRGRKRTDFCKDSCKKVWNLAARKLGVKAMSRRHNMRITEVARVARAKGKAAERLAHYIEERASV